MMDLYPLAGMDILPTDMYNVLARVVWKIYQLKFIMVTRTILKILKSRNQIRVTKDPRLK